jgi:hypothetical protein
VHAARQLPPVTTAVAHPCDRISIEGVFEAAKLGLIAPILVGPPARIRGAAQQAEADISDFPLEESARRAVRMIFPIRKRPMRRKVRQAIFRSEPRRKRADKMRPR